MSTESQNETQCGIKTTQILEFQWKTFTDLNSKITSASTRRTDAYAPQNILNIQIYKTIDLYK